MERCCGCVKDSITLIDSGVNLIVSSPAGLDIKHHIADRIVLVPMIVVENVDRSLIEVPVFILGVTSLFMCIDSPVHKVDKFILVVDNSCRGWCNIVWHAVISLD